MGSKLKDLFWSLFVIPMFGYEICSLHLTHPTTGAVGCYDQCPGSKLGFRGQCLAQGHFDKQTVFGSGGSRGSNRRPYG